jgi:hypothetical protein
LAVNIELRTKEATHWLAFRVNAFATFCQVKIVSIRHKVLEKVSRPVAVESIVRLFLAHFLASFSEKALANILREERRDNGVKFGSCIDNLPVPAHDKEVISAKRHYHE